MSPRGDSSPAPPSPPPSSSRARPRPEPADNGSELEVFSLLDGASPNYPAISREFEDQRRLAADRERPLGQRLEALEDIIDSEVGDTNLTRARNLERRFGLRQIYLKLEGGNPTGTQKDRIAFAHAMDALRRGFDTVTAATCGNYGSALALAAATAGLGAVIFVPERYHTRRITEMVSYGATLERVPGDYEEAVQVSIARAAAEELYDANPGGANTALQLSAYGQIAYEIYDELRDAPRLMAVPVSNGTTLAGIYKGFLSLYRRGKTSRLPLMVAGSSHNKNPIVTSFRKNLPHCEDLNPRRIHETVVNEPLINWHSLDGEQALAAIRSTGGWAANASDKAMRSYARLLAEQEGFNVLPASTAGLAVLLERHTTGALPGDRYVVLLTGRK
ncbi:MAG: pyridoxal-phosphate dependent enzyme [Deltaproteobacteria bacterium]|nr:pyridoxal-phosphate dependent enzyme [Deltaproteobacteria bacterium]